MLITHPLSAKHSMEDERDSADNPRSIGSDRSGSRSGFELGAKLRARMEKLSDWRISPSSIKAPKDARQFHGGHATVSKAFLLTNKKKGYSRCLSYYPRGVLRLCRQSFESDDHIREAADHRRDPEGELDDEEKDDGQEYGFDCDSRWQGEFVAVKKPRIGDNKDLERVLGLTLRETEFLVHLSHPNIVKLKGFVEYLSKDIIWLVFPWAENGNLKDFVASRDWEIPERISLIRNVAEGLEYLHSRKPPICHGDLKSLNVLVNWDRRAAITDFGSARRLTEHDLNRQPALVQNQQQPVHAKFSTLSKTITLTGNIYTLRWAAPELLNDDRMSLWSDIWALGWIAYEVLTNSIPFHDVPADIVVVERVIKGDLPSINEHARVSLFEELCSLMTMCWNSNPSDRPTAKDYLHALSDMPMVVPNERGWSYSTFSNSFSSEVLMQRGKGARKSGDSVMALACFTEADRIYMKNSDRKGRASALSCLAELHVHREEYNEAIKLYSEALQIHTDIGDRQGRASALWGLAEVHRLRNKYNEGVAGRSDGVQIPTDVDDRRGRADALWGLAEIYRLRKEYSEAIALYSEALQIRTDIGDRQGRADALWGLAAVHQVRNEYSKAIVLYSEALQICTDISDRQGRADALWCLASVHQVRNKYSKAIALYSEALQIRTDIGDRQGRAAALWGLAEVHRVRNECSEAIKLYSAVLQIRTDVGDKQGRASALWGLAEAHRVRNEYTEAIKLYSEVLQIRTDIGNERGRASALWGLAEVHRVRYEYSEAITLYSEVLQIHTNFRNKRGRASALWGLAEVHRVRYEYGEAIKLYSAVLGICTDVGDRQRRADALWSLAEVHRDRNEYSKAIKLYSAVLQIRTDVGDRRGRASALSGLAQVRGLRYEDSEAIVLYSEVLQIHTDIGNKRGRASALWGLAELHRVRNEYSKAIALYSEALQISIDIGDKKGRADIHRRQDRQDDATSLYEQAAELVEQSGNDDAAAYALKKAAYIG